MAENSHPSDLLEAASSVDYNFSNDQSTNDQCTNEQSTNDQSSIKHSNNDQSSDGKSTNVQSTNDQSSNDQFCNNQSINDQSTNDESANDQSTNDHFTNDQSSNDQSSSDEFTSDEYSSDESSSDQSEAKQNIDDDLDPSDLLRAACSGNVENVTKLLDKYSFDQTDRKGNRSALANIKNKEGDTALWLALYQHQDNMVAIRTLVSAGADINALDRWGETPLSYAAQCHGLRFVRELIQIGADVNGRDKYGRTLLMKTCGREQLLTLLVEAGADLNAQYYGTDYIQMLPGQTALMTAANCHNVNWLKLLLEAGANVNVKRNNGENALCMAVEYITYERCYSDAIECLRLLINYGADVNVQNADGNTALLHLAKLAVQPKEDPYSIANECIGILIDAGADINMKTSDGETALMLAIKAGTTKNQYHDPFLTFSVTRRSVAKCVELFTKAKSYVVSTNTEGQTALMYAVKDDNLVSLLSILVKAGAVIDHQDSNGMTALSHAMSSGSLECACWLIKSGADVTKINIKGETVLMHAAKNDCFVSLLPILVKAGAVVDLQDFSGMTALTHAVSNGSHGCVRWLINFGASVNIRDNSGKTPLHYLMFANNSDGNATLHYFRFVNNRDRAAEQCLEALLSKLPDVNARDNDGMTPLMYVAQKYQGSHLDTSTIKKLLKHGAELNLVDNKGQTALIHSLRPSPHPDDVFIEKEDRRFRRNNVEFLVDMGADFSVGHLAEGQLARLCDTRGDRGLIKLRVGNDVDLEVPWNNFLSAAHTGDRGLLQFLILNGVMPLPFTMADKDILYGPYGSSRSVLEVSIKRGHVMITKYLIATCYLRSADLIFSINTSDWIFEYKYAKEAASIIENLRSQPMPLVKLCFVAVSTAFGASPGRQERVKNSQLPPKLQRMLLFQENTSRLCSHQWDKIPLTFCPEDYENLPQSRPLLYNWPVGRALVLCDCGCCDGTMYKYDQEEEDTENGGE